ncbi:hypothetical protein BCR35DRAFT_51428 [Leucosporidium creatinivorum]|uniref:Uncharacterized protein n=1 Tax=Leucosporidium creatinivorum TaxID=106004 RepID=A0A1Y2BWS9_9BASI|nr:hypothetical protein BCR35DRAFT_51428 [Leucosporidium creatinivorum]
MISIDLPPPHLTKPHLPPLPPLLPSKPAERAEPLLTRRRRGSYVRSHRRIRDGSLPLLLLRNLCPPPRQVGDRGNDGPLTRHLLLPRRWRPLVLTPTTLLHRPPPPLLLQHLPPPLRSPIASPLPLTSALPSIREWRETRRRAGEALDPLPPPRVN